MRLMHGFSNNNNARTHTHIDEQKYEMEGYTKISRRHNSFFLCMKSCVETFNIKFFPPPFLSFPIHSLIPRCSFSFISFFFYADENIVVDPGHDTKHGEPPHVFIIVP